MRRCIFCGVEVLSREDIWPQWVIRLLKKSPEEIVPMQARRKDLLTKWTKMGNRALEFKAVCPNRNNGWMSTLENHTSPILIPMISNCPVTLNSRQQLKIAQWTMKCAMLFEFMDGGGRFYTEEDRSQFRTTLVLPGDFLEVWLAHYSGTVFRAATDHRGVKPVGASGKPYQGHIMTMVFGPLVIQILNIKCVAANDMTSGLKLKLERDWKDSIVRIDPAIPSVHWPPKISLNDSDRSLKDLSARFITKTTLVS